MYTTKDIAIVILNWNGKHLLEQFLSSVVCYSEQAKIYVADNASEDDSIVFLEAAYSQVIVIRNAHNYGYAKGYNEALQSVKEPILCLLNSDIEVTKGWLSPIISLYNTTDTAIIQPKILDYKKQTHYEYAGAAGGFIDRYGYPYCRGRLFNTIEADNGQYNDTVSIFWASGACFFIKASVFNKLGGFDTSYFAHMEEIDLCWRAFNNHHSCMYAGTSTVYHLGGATLSNSNAKKTYLNFRNSLYTLVKNTDKRIFSRTLTRLLLDGIAGLRFLVLGKVSHCLAIIRAHISFYSKLRYVLNERKKYTQRSGYATSKSIVWSYYIKKKTYY